MNDKNIIKLEYEIVDNNSIKSTVMKKFYYKSIDNKSLVLFWYWNFLILIQKYTKKTIIFLIISKVMQFMNIAFNAPYIGQI